MDPSERDIIKQALRVYDNELTRVLQAEDLILTREAVKNLTEERGKARIALANILAAERAEAFAEELRQKARDRRARDKANIASLTK